MAGNEVTILIDLGGLSSKIRKVNFENFQLNCVPVINLFSKISEPITINHRNYEYLLTADRVRELTTEIHSVINVTASEPGARVPQIIPQFSALGKDKNLEENFNNIFWSSSRRKSLRKDFSGTDVFLNFIDKNHSSGRPSYPVLYAKILCTNRRLAEQIPVKASLIGE